MNPDRRYHTREINVKPDRTDGSIVNLWISQYSSHWVWCAYIYVLMKFVLMEYLPKFSLQC